MAFGVGRKERAAAGRQQDVKDMKAALEDNIRRMKRQLGVEQLRQGAEIENRRSRCNSGRRSGISS